MLKMRFPVPANAAGCIPNDYWDYGVAVGPLNVPSGVYFPVRIRITGWSDGSAVSGLDLKPDAV